MLRPLDAEQLENQLGDILWAETSSKRASALSLARLMRPQQDFVLHWVRILEKDNTACAYQFLTHAHHALTRLSLPEVEGWIIQGLDVYDQSGLYAAVEVFRNVDGFLERARAAQVGASLEEHATVLERVVLGLSGRRLALAAAETIHTDTETLFLPATASHFESREDNFRFLKAAVAYLWAQTRFGTWRLGNIEILLRFDDLNRALRLFHTFETLRLDARIARELPGIHRDMQHLNALAGQCVCPPHWEIWRERLLRAGDRSQDSLTLVADVVTISYGFQGYRRRHHAGDVVHIGEIAGLVAATQRRSPRRGSRPARIWVACMRWLHAPGSGGQALLCGKSAATHRLRSRGRWAARWSGPRGHPRSLTQPVASPAGE